MTHSVEALIAAERLPADYREVVTQFWQPLADRIAREASRQRPLIVGVNGAQGSGKSTLCRFLEVLLKPHDLRVVTLSLDDLYRTRAERADLAAKAHPLFATRGVPGTHDIGLALGLIEDMQAGRSFTLPRFDKSIDDRADKGETIHGPVDVLLFEGWCVGAVPQDQTALIEPINRLEAQEDRGGVWRGLVNRFLGGDYADLFAQIDLLVILKVQGFEAVAANRRLQERKLAEANPGAPGLMDDAAITRFLDHYERLTRHQFAEMPARADVLFEIGPDQRPLRLPDGLEGARSIT